MSERSKSRSRSRSPARNGDSAPPADGEYKDNGGGSGGGDNSNYATNGGGDSGAREEVKLYVGNLDYGMSPFRARSA